MLEGLIAILIFSMAILGVVGMQATAITRGTEAQYRADAAFLANQLLGQMWAHAGSGVFVTINGVQQLTTRQQATAPAPAGLGIDVSRAADAPNLYNYHCINCTVAAATAAGIKAGDPEFVNWIQSIQGTANQAAFLPGVSNTGNWPDIDVHCSVADGGLSYGAGCPFQSATQVTITLYWQQGAKSPVHQYSTLSNIKPN